MILSHNSNQEQCYVVCDLENSNLHYAWKVMEKNVI